MPTAVPPLPFFCINVLARFPDQLHQLHHRRAPASAALLDAFHHTRDPCLWVTLAQLVQPLPPHLHEFDLPLSHPALPLLQKIPDSPDFSLVTLLSLPNCASLRDDDIHNIRTLRRLHALDLRGCSISSRALANLARGLSASSNDDSARADTIGLRLLSLHGCPNIDDDALSILQRFPLLSVVVHPDLRFTRCTPTVVNAHLFPLGFRPSDNNSLFYPAPLSLALSALEKVALTALDPISLYSCPPESIFRVHIDELHHLPFHPKKAATVGSPNVSHLAIRTTSEDIVVFMPPLPKPAKNGLPPSYKPFVSSTAVPVVPVAFSIDRPTHRNLVSNVSSFYENPPAHSRHSAKSILPLSAQAVQSSEGSRLDSLAVARSPPPWKIVDAYKPDTQVAVACPKNASSDDSRRRHPISRRTDQTLNITLKVDHARLHKRCSDAVAEMVHQFASKRLKVESEIAPTKMRTRISLESRNPFAKNANLAFIECSLNPCDKPRHSVHESSNEAEPGVQLRACRSLPSETAPPQGTGAEGTVKPLKPITTLKPPILPKQSLSLSPRHTSKHKIKLKQSRLVFS